MRCVALRYGAQGAKRHVVVPPPERARVSIDEVRALLGPDAAPTPAGLSAAELAALRAYYALPVVPAKLRP